METHLDNQLPHRRHHQHLYYFRDHPYRSRTARWDQVVTRLMYPPAHHCHHPHPHYSRCHHHRYPVSHPYPVGRHPLHHRRCLHQNQQEVDRYHSRFLQYQPGCRYHHQGLHCYRDHRSLSRHSPRHQVETRRGYRLYRRRRYPQPADLYHFQAPPCQEHRRYHHPDPYYRRIDPHHCRSTH